MQKCVEKPTKMKKEKSPLIQYWHGNKDNFTSAMYICHIFRSEGSSSFPSEDKIKLKKCLKWQRMWEKYKAAEYSLVTELPSKGESVCRLVTLP